jgi:hypothetical protein
MDTLYLVQSDNGTQLKVEITRDDTGLPVDLTGATPTLRFKKKNTGVILTDINSSSFSSNDLEAGIAVFQFNAAALAITAGDYVAEIQVTFTDGTVETVYEELQFVVREDY